MERPPDDPRKAPPPESPASEPPPGAAPEEEPRQADLLAVGLLVFFVSLIGIVGALLLAPVLF